MFSLKTVVFALVATAVLGLSGCDIGLQAVNADQSADLAGLHVRIVSQLKDGPDAGTALDEQTTNWAFPTNQPSTLVALFGDFVNAANQPAPGKFELKSSGQLSLTFVANSRSLSHSNAKISIISNLVLRPVFVGALDLETGVLPAHQYTNHILAHKPNAVTLPNGQIEISTNDPGLAPLDSNGNPIGDAVENNGVFDLPISVTYNWLLVHDEINCAPGSQLPGCAQGDPQFNGFVGQSYQIHGVSNTVYNVISAPRFQVNALFTYLESGKCRRGTQCFSHPGNYFGEMGLLLADDAGAVTRVQLQAGPVDAGMRVLINDSELPSSNQTVTIGTSVVDFSTPFDFRLTTEDFTILFSNSDMFLNEQVAINTPLLHKIQEYKRAAKSNSADADVALRSLPHGLLGQTWQSKVYPNRWKYIEGSLFDYVSSDIFGTTFKFNRFAY
jgi:hypothetical protein